MTYKQPDTLRAAAQAVVERWDAPLWKDVPATAEYIGRLRAALAAPQQEVQEPVAWAYQWKQGNPISWYVTVARWPESDIWHEYPLYTAPQQAEPVHDWEAEYIKLEKLYNEARMELYDEEMLHNKALDQLDEMVVALEKLRQKPKRTVTYVCPVCAASLEKQE